MFILTVNELIRMYNSYLIYDSNIIEIEAYHLNLSK